MKTGSVVASALKLCSRSALRWTMAPVPGSYLFIPINGAGLGHLSRCLAIAGALKRLDSGADISFFTTSIAVPLVQRAGYRCYHLPPVSSSGLDPDLWNRTFRDLLVAVIEAHQPETVAFDGTWPYEGLKSVMRICPRVRFVWIRRGLHRSDSMSRDWTEQAEQFSLTVVPGELDSLNDSVPPRVHLVDPIVSIEPHVLLSREDVRSKLGLDPADPAVYVQLGAGNINAIQEIETRVVADLRGIPGMQIVLARSPIMLREESGASADVVLFDYPNARYFNGFDAAILAGGYNSVYEALACGLPAVFIPNESTGADDQVRRAREAARLQGWTCMNRWSGCELRDAVAELLSLRRNVDGVGRGWHGATQAAALLADRARGDEDESAG